MPEIRKMSDTEDEDSSRQGTPSPIQDLDAPKHPLQSSWTLWYFKNDRSKDWESNQKKVITFSTVEDFWALYNHIEIASELNQGCDYSLFKEGIKPMWEDEHNEAGGKWLLPLEKHQRKLSLDKYWLEIMMCLIGEAFGETGTIVNGAVVNLRPRADKISVWLADSKDANSILSIGRCIKNRLSLRDGQRINFEEHKDSMNKAGSQVRAKYYV